MSNGCPTSQKVRRQFLDYFREKGHRIFPSSPLFLPKDPSLLFTNAGMNPFKPFFLGVEKASFSRAASVQKCIRAGGKHNDLENVGHTSRHLTFFEMLGNFSFGDYYKEAAISFAWEVSTEVFGFPQEKIWPTVYMDDDEAFSLWMHYVPEERITRLGREENFWSMGQTGPCGPCSELLFDRGERYSTAKTPLEDKAGERFLEFWNLVFMEWDQKSSGEKVPLPSKCIDTGGGLERIVLLQMGKENVFETDVLAALIGELSRTSGCPYAISGVDAPSFHVIADHIRSLCFSIADGIVPGNTERGYVLRKIVRRAVCYGKHLNLHDPFLFRLVDPVIQLMGEDYPEIKRAKMTMENILLAEEKTFFATLRRGGNLLNKVIDRAKAGSRKILSGEDAFQLKDTYGLPFQEICLFAKDAGLTVDESAYMECEKKAKAISKRGQKEQVTSSGDKRFEELYQEKGATHFIGYDETCSVAKITALKSERGFVDTFEEGEKGMVFLEMTPFYAEKGGQTGDRGTLEQEQTLFLVEDCQWSHAHLIAHIGQLSKGTLSIGQTVEARVNEERRRGIALHHTATHLLHEALRFVLGEHVRQAGSIVEAERLRFDFTHHAALSEKEWQAIENRVNEAIWKNSKVATYETAFQQIENDPSILHLFEDQYGALVRVVDMDISKELCGGTHAQRTGDLGFFRITKESSIAAGIRRIEGVVEKAAWKIAREEQKLLAQASSLLKAKKETLTTKIEQLQEQCKSLTQLIEQKKKEEKQNQAKSCLERGEEKEGLFIIAEKVDVPLKELRDLALCMTKQCKSGVIVLLAEEGDRALFLVSVTSDLIRQGWNAGVIVQWISKWTQCRGGGKADIAQAGGPTLAESEKILQQIKTELATLHVAP